MKFRISTFSKHTLKKQDLYPITGGSSGNSITQSGSTITRTSGADSDMSGSDKDNGWIKPINNLKLWK